MSRYIRATSGPKTATAMGLTFQSPDPVQSHGHAAARGQVDAESVACLYALLADSQTAGKLIRVGTVGEDPSFVFTMPEEIQRDFQIARVPVGHGAEIPLATAPARDGDVPGRFAIQNFRLVPHGWNFFQKLDARLIVVSLWIVREHRQGAFENHVHGQLGVARALCNR